MAVRDVYNGQSGEWRGGMWFPDQPRAVIKDVFEIHTRPIDDYHNSRSIDDLSREMKDVFRNQNEARAKMIREERSFNAYLFLGFMLLAAAICWFVFFAVR
jgi:hypothetical protein